MIPACQPDDTFDRLLLRHITAECVDVCRQLTRDTTVVQRILAAAQSAGRAGGESDSRSLSELFDGLESFEGVIAASGSEEDTRMAEQCAQMRLESYGLSYAPAEFVQKLVCGSRDGHSLSEYRYALALLQNSTKKPEVVQKLVFSVQCTRFAVCALVMLLIVAAISPLTLGL